jgi:hypothetical protein
MIYELLRADPLYISNKVVADTLLAMLRAYKFKQYGISRDNILEHHIPETVQTLWGKLSDEGRVVAYMAGHIAYDKWASTEYEG